MPPVFNADEILKIAENIEKNGTAYYKKAAELSEDPEAVKVFKRLAAMESEHAVTFGKMIASLEKGSGADYAPVDTTGDEDAYLKSIASTYLFDNSGNPLEDLNETPDPANIIRFAIRKEQESISFYLLMKESVPPALGQEWIDAIVCEETSHISWLLNMMNKFN